jgi:hypothetical protein
MLPASSVASTPHPAAAPLCLDERQRAEGERRGSERDEATGGEEERGSRMPPEKEEREGGDCGVGGMRQGRGVIGAYIHRVWKRGGGGFVGRIWAILFLCLDSAHFKKIQKLI